MFNGGIGDLGGEATKGSGSQAQTQEVNPVEVSEDVIWKSRAMEAEEKLAECEARVIELESELASANESVVSVQRRGEIERELTAARTVDLETACLLTEAAVDEMDEPDVAVAVREIKARKPYLFSCANGGEFRGGGSSMSSYAVRENDGLGMMASNARSSGDRNELLRYLRARRGG